MKALLLFLITGCALVTPDEAHLSYLDGGQSGHLDRLDGSGDMWAWTYGVTWYLPQPNPVILRDCRAHEAEEDLPPADLGDSVPVVQEDILDEPWWANRLDQILAFVLGSGLLAGGLYGHKKLKGEG